MKPLKYAIGIDFDNTIACYDDVFFSVASKLGILNGEKTLTKAEVKERLLTFSQGETEWQRLQGQVYGKYMSSASVFPGFFEFLCRTRVRGHSVYIVSHKSEFGHFDIDKVPLRIAAMDWLREKGFVGPESMAIHRENVYFEPTRESKVERIRRLGCTHFIDDLNAVFAEPDFPSCTEELLFAPQASVSWRTLSQRMYGDWEEDEIGTIV